MISTRKRSPRLRFASCCLAFACCILAGLHYSRLHIETNRTEGVTALLESARNDAKIASLLRTEIVGGIFSVPTVPVLIAEVRKTAQPERHQGSTATRQEPKPSFSSAKARAKRRDPVVSPPTMSHPVAADSRSNSSRVEAEVVPIELRGLGTRRPYFVHFHKAGMCTAERIGIHFNILVAFFLNQVGQLCATRLGTAS